MSLGWRRVLAYLRKSRDEMGQDDVLSKHRQMLLELCEREGYSPTWYEEIGNSERIVGRPQFQALLSELENDDYYAVISVDTDRLSRGDVLSNPDIVTIYSTLTKTNTILHTVKDGKLNPSEDKIYLGIKTLFANMEYDTIKKRLQDGKREGTKQGKWTNGKPPYPYVYNSTEQSVGVDEGKMKHYRYCIESYLSGKTISQIATDLNGARIPSPGGRYWNTTNVHRILRDEFHLGKVVTHKSIGSGHKNRYKDDYVQLPRSQWKMHDGSHIPLKTQDEHNRILAILSQNSLVPNRSKRGIYALNGLLYCGKCGRRMQLSARYRGEKKLISAKCVYISWEHNPPKKCGQRGFTLTDAFMGQLHLKIDRAHLERLKNGRSPEGVSSIAEQISTYQDELKKHSIAIERIQSQYEDGLIEKKVWLERSKIRQDQIDSLIASMEELGAIQESVQPVSIEELQRRMDEFKKLCKSAYSQEEYNRLLRRIVKKLVYNNVDGTGMLDIHLL